MHDMPRAERSDKAHGAARARRRRAPREAPAAHVLRRRGAARRARPCARSRQPRARAARRAVLGARSRAARAADLARARAGRRSSACRSCTSRTRSPRRASSPIRSCASRRAGWSRAASPTRCSPASRRSTSELDRHDVYVQAGGGGERLDVLGIRRQNGVAIVREQHERGVDDIRTSSTGSE